PGLATRRRSEGPAPAIWEDWFETYDALVCPVMPALAFHHDQEGDPFTRTVVIDGSPRPYVGLLSWTGLISVLGLPSTVAPVGRTSAGLPVGVQVVSAFLRDRESIRLAGILARVAGSGYERRPTELRGPGRTSSSSEPENACSMEAGGSDMEAK